MKRPIRIMLFLAAALLGGAAAWWLIPHWNDARALSRISSDSEALREQGWRWLRRAPRIDAPPRAAQVLDRINDQLIDAGDEAVLHAGDALRPLDLWDWQQQPVELILRELSLRAASHEGDAALAATAMRDCPFDAPAEQVIEVTQRLLNGPRADIRRIALHAMMNWAGVERADLLRNLRVRDSDAALERLRRLAMSWGRAQLADEFDLVAPVDVLESQLMQHIRASPTDANRVLEVLAQWEREEQPAFAYALRHSDDPAAQRVLEQMAESGDDVAQFALHAREPTREESLAREIADKPREPVWRRRLAAWRLQAIEAGLLHDLLHARAADDDGSVYATALLAERHLDRSASAALAEAWMRDLDTDRKRAGALLAALLGEHLELLAQLAELPGDDRLRLTAHLASLSANHEHTSRELTELGYRALRADDGDYDADVLLCLLVAGDRTAPGRLVEPPRGNWRITIQSRAMLIERFLPQWHDDAGRPISVSERAVLLHFDWLRARWLLDARRLRFHHGTRTYQPLR